MTILFFTMIPENNIITNVQRIGALTGSLECQWQARGRYQTFTLDHKNNTPSNRIKIF